MDKSSGWEALSPAQVAQLQSSSVGVAVVEAWARSLPECAAVLDLGGGPGGPRSAALARPGFAHYALEASPSLAAAYRQRFPYAQVACEPAEESSFFGRTFDAVLAWGLLFLLPPEAQEQVIQNVGRALKLGGKFIFTAPRQACTWDDLFTGRPSISLGEAKYESLLNRAGLALVATQEDDGENHYYSSIKVQTGAFRGADGRAGWKAAAAWSWETRRSGSKCWEPLRRSSLS